MQNTVIFLANRCRIEAIQRRENKARGATMVDASTQCSALDAARNQQGPVSAAALARLVRSGAINRDTLIWFAGMPDWRPAGQVNELASLFGSSGGAQPTRPAGPAGGAAGMRAPA